jgi:hypothetical protein
LAGLPIRINRVAFREEKLVLDVLQRIFPAEAFLEVVCLTLRWPAPVARRRRWWQFDALIEFVQELLHLPLHGLLAHHTDSRLVRRKDLGRVRSVFRQAPVMPCVRLRASLVEDIDWPRRSFQTRKRRTSAVEKGAERKRHAGRHLVLLTSEEADDLLDAIKPSGAMPQSGSFGFEEFDDVRRAFRERVLETGGERLPPGPHLARFDTFDTISGIRQANS